MSTSIILIGPSKTGKTTLSKLLGEALSLPAIDLDDLRWGYYAQLGYDAAKAKEIRRQGGMKALAEYWKPFDIYGVECVLRDYPSDHVIAFGAGHSVYEDDAQFQRAKIALLPFPHVLLILPSPDVEVSVQLTRQRLKEVEPDMPDDFFDAVADMNRYFIVQPSNSLLATIMVYTAGKSPAESCAEIVQRLRSHPA